MKKLLLYSSSLNNPSAGYQALTSLCCSRRSGRCWWPNLILPLLYTCTLPRNINRNGTMTYLWILNVFDHNHLHVFLKPRFKVTWLTGWKSTSKEHIEKVLRGNISLEISVMCPMPVSRVGFFFTIDIILPSFFRVTEDCVSITYSCWRPGNRTN